MSAPLHHTHVTQPTWLFPLVLLKEDKLFRTMPCARAIGEPSHTENWLETLLHVTNDQVGIRALSKPLSEDMLVVQLIYD